MATVDAIELETKVKDRYRHVAEQPNGAYHFEAGHALADRPWVPGRPSRQDSGRGDRVLRRGRRQRRQQHLDQGVATGGRLAGRGQQRVDVGAPEPGGAGGEAALARLGPRARWTCRSSRSTIAA